MAEVEARGRRRAGFRDDVQGLRAVSVLLVIAAHAGFGLVAGGYIGVDCFFVISGFLITGLLLREASRHGRVSLVGFYARRARRIIPAASLVLVAACVATALFKPLSEGHDVFTDAVWAAFFAANIRFASVNTDYFAADRAVSPVEHYWSLAVEEQFYLFWPLVIIVVILLLRRRARRRPAADGGEADPRRAITWVLVVAIVASLAWSVVDTHRAPDVAYFSTLTRAWELAVGSLAAVLVARFGSGLFSRRGTAEATTIAGVALIAAAALSFDARTPVPGWIMVIPVVGTALILVAGDKGAAPSTVGRLLSVPPMRAIGDWSYSLYLWHFPVLKIAHARWGRLDALHLTACLVAVGVLSYVTYRFIEEPFRRGALWDRPWRAISLYPVGVVVLVLGVVASNGWLDHRANRFAGNPSVSVADYRGHHLGKDPVVALVRASALAARDHKPVPGDLVPGLIGIRSDTAPLGACDYRTGTERLCANGDPSADRSIVLLGDSHARAWSPAVEEIGRRYGFRVYTLVYSGCPANLAIRLDPESGGYWPACDHFVHWALDQVAKLQPAYTLISNAPLSPVVDPVTGRIARRHHQPKAYLKSVERGLAAEIDSAREHSGRVVVLGATPNLRRAPGPCLSGAKDLGDCMFQPLAALLAIQHDFAGVARSHDAGFVDAEKWFCSPLGCPPVIGRIIPMRDREHMTTEYAEHIAPSLARALGVAGPPPGD